MKSDFIMMPKLISETGIFEGYAAIFDVADSANDIIRHSAFKNSLERTGSNGVKMLLNHAPEFSLGTWIDIVEDHIGLRVRGKLNLKNQTAKKIYRSILAGELDGLSIGFKTIKSTKPRSALNFRELIEIDLWEISITKFPMQSKSRMIPAIDMSIVEKPLKRLILSRLLGKHQSIVDNYEKAHLAQQQAEQ